MRFRSQQTNRTLGWNIGVQDWYGGQVEQNLIIHNSNPSVNNTFGISLNGGSRQVTIANNYIYGLKGSGIIVGSRDPQDREGNIITNNILQDPDSNSRILQVESLEGLSIGDNTYFNEAPSRFSLFSATCTFEEWVELTDDNSAYAEHSFPDPTRSIETYQEYIGEDGTIDSFISACREQNRFNRDQRYAAEEVNQWIRAGFSDSLSN
ncbi:MAG: right-handed parallel beta-helix repeat-containing protein [Spirochaetaceae bacterium]|nr:right-handed parallel beta-helix repeat-containing protein [Spirochaetaceae bacterium]